MKSSPSWIAMLMTAALAAGTAAASTGKEPTDDPAIRVQLSPSPRTPLPIFLLEVETLAGFEFIGEVSWSANEMQLGSEELLTLDGSWFGVRPQPLSAEAVVCVELEGRLSLGGDLGRDVFERACVVHVHVDPEDAVHPVTAERSLVEGQKKRRDNMTEPALRR